MKWPATDVFCQWDELVVYMAWEMVWKKNRVQFNKDESKDLDWGRINLLQRDRMGKK